MNPEISPRSLPHGLYLISDAAMLRDGSFLPFLEEALEAGLRIVQLRAKDFSRDEKVRIGREMRKLTRRSGSLFLVNDEPELAVELDADGVHVGQEDLSPSEARRIVGPDRLIGLSTHNHEQILRARSEPVDYIGVGPVFPTTTKENPDPVTGVGLIEWASRNDAPPIVAIGGINLENAETVLQSGARCAAVITAVSRRKDPLATLRDFMKRLQQ